MLCLNQQTDELVQDKSTDPQRVSNLGMVLEFALAYIMYGSI